MNDPEGRVSAPDTSTLSEQSVVVSRGAPGVMGECENCHERWDGHGQRLAAKAQAAAKRHAQRTGHTVYVARERGTYYRKPARDE